MTTPMHDCYKPIPTPEGVTLEACPICGSPAELFRYSEGPHEKTETLVCCTQGDRFGPQTSDLFCGCLLYLPSAEFHFSRMKQAVDYWNQYAVALKQMRDSKCNGS